MAAATALIVLTGLMTACHAPPPYESKYQLPPSPTPVTKSPIARLPLPTDASFVDTFDRPDTQLGLDDGWDMRGRYLGGVLPQATDGFLQDGAFTYAGDSMVYAARHFPGTVRRIGSVGRWEQRRPGAETTIAMAIASNDKLLSDKILFTASRSRWDLFVHRDKSGIQPFAHGEFSPMLELDRNYQFELEATDTAVDITVPGDEVTTQVSTAGLLSGNVYWQEFVKPEELPAGVVFTFDTVWAAEDGQPLVHVPAPAP